MAEMWKIADAACCQACAERVIEERGPFREDQVARVFDPTVCANCGHDAGRDELPRLAGLPACNTCAEGLRNRPFPIWIRASFAVLVVLLVASQIVGARYFGAAANVVRAERLIDSGDHAEALALLDGALEQAPDSAKVLLLKIKAALLAGDPATAYATLDRFGTRTDEQELIAEVNAILVRVEDAVAKAQEAGRLANAEDDEAALRMARRAASLYPEWPVAAELVESCEAGVAFQKKDYDKFFEISARIAARNPDSSGHVAVLASALACRYAVTGDAGLKTQAEEVLARAESLIRDAEERAAFDEYAERIRHRIGTREIIPRSEYNRRFRPEKKD
jgi:tetratricopeptide (TPR) repeat protein